MKYIWLFLGIICLIAMTILYFQMLAGATIMVPFFTEWIQVSIFVIFIILLGIGTGTFITLGIKGFTSSDDSLDDDFDL